MATFEVKVYELRIEPHPNADALELAVVGDYRSIVRKGQFKTGDLGVYIPEAAVLPEWLIEKLGLTGKLAGKEKNRVKAIKLRGILSQGLVYPVIREMFTTIEVLITDTALMDESEIYVGEAWRHFPVEVGTDCTEVLGITKYEPPIPVHMAGEVFNAHGYTLGYDIENYKKFPHVLIDGELVIMTEKLHGTWTCLGWHPDVEGNFVVTSKGLSGRGLAFKMNEANKDNLYLRSLEASRGADGKTIVERMRYWFGFDVPIYVLGETYGRGVQDLTYGLDRPQFRIFDVYVGHPGQGKYLDWDQLKWVCGKFQVETVPLVYEGPFSREKLMEVTSGKDLITGTHIREGVVVKPLTERRHDDIGRVVLKSVSEDYLLRGEGTEYN